MIENDKTGTFKKFKAKRAKNEDFTVTYTVTMHNLEFAEKIEAYREKHNISGTDFFSKAAESLLSESK